MWRNVPPPFHVLWNIWLFTFSRSQKVTEDVFTLREGISCKLWVQTRLESSFENYFHYATLLALPQCGFIYLRYIDVEILRITNTQNLVWHETTTVDESNIWACTRGFEVRFFAMLWDSLQLLHTAIWPKSLSLNSVIYKCVIGILRWLQRDNI